MNIASSVEEGVNIQEMLDPRNQTNENSNKKMSGVAKHHIDLLIHDETPRIKSNTVPSLKNRSMI